MIKKFFLNLLSSFLGAWIAIVLSGAVIVLIVMACLGKFALSEGGPNVSVKDDTILVLDLDGEIEETESAKQLDYAMLMGGEVEKPQTLLSLVTALDEALEDPRVKAVYVKCGMLSAPPATVHALHEALAAYKKKTGNPVIAYGDVMLQSTLYIASCADSIFLNPQGALQLQGIGGTSLYFKDLFDKIGVEWQMAKVGTYKSAVEPYTANEMSEPARRQLMELYQGIWKTIRKGIADGRKVREAYIDSLTNQLILTSSAEEVVKTGLVSATAYERQMDDKLGAVINADPDDINFIDAQAFGSVGNMVPVKGDHIAVLYATGEIQENSRTGIDCYKLVPVICELADDDDVQGLVLRVNSPGGSVFGSQQISDALSYFQSKGKPVVVSMGDYAASGGYWISCESDYIFADPLTITGSIGIFGLVPNGQKLLRNIGVTPQQVSTNPDANLGIPVVPLTPVQMAALQRSIDRGYRQFITKVSKGRDIPVANVDSIAQGRVWIASTAKQLGLVDELGSLQKAIQHCGKLADMKADDIQVGYYPDLEPSIWDFIPTAGNGSVLSTALQRALGRQASPLLVTYLQDLLKRNHRQALLPACFRVRI